MGIVDAGWPLIAGALALLAGATWVLFGMDSAQPVPLDAERAADSNTEGEGVDDHT
ncbi:MAG: hypothetical protein WCL53_03505 [Chloroflexota bacterium]